MVGPAVGPPIMIERDSCARRAKLSRRVRYYQMPPALYRGGISPWSGSRDTKVKPIMKDEDWAEQFALVSACKHVACLKPKKFKRTFSHKKQMATASWDHQGVLLIDFMELGTTTNAAAYCATLRRLRSSIRNKRRGMLTSGVVWLHDNARPPGMETEPYMTTKNIYQSANSNIENDTQEIGIVVYYIFKFRSFESLRRAHSVAVTLQLLASFRWEVFDHPPYSPDLAPSDFHLFPALKKKVAARTAPQHQQRTAGHSDTTWLNSKAANILCRVYWVAGAPVRQVSQWASGYFTSFTCQRSVFLGNVLAHTAAGPQSAHSPLKCPLEGFSAYEADKGTKGYSDTGIKCVIATTCKGSNWNAEFSSCYGTSRDTIISLGETQLRRVVPGGDVESLVSSAEVSLPQAVHGIIKQHECSGERSPSTKKSRMSSLSPMRSQGEKSRQPMREQG
ncbi:hypothetical protein PR048_031449 [Dryococelus australis]|uniref:Transposase n=1 Tax=Dryococelus australis TaxID=614101 RepID=A0ABQ9G9C7_9NEOP|nr:hypothetical protein PR048_031449 [Dryococelus australis]